MPKYYFATNINCGGCVAKVTPFLNAIEKLESWSVDTTNPKKILTVQTAADLLPVVVEAVKKAGFKIEPLANS
ncbi:MAG: heavy-metal-associated domain-containing protein [Cytophagales bacterium]|nr:heavy-metal-associated domain-containing protein [Cytophagales bacterium]